MPDEFPVERIPDDVMVPTMLKSSPITENLIVPATGKMMLVVRPMFPGRKYAEVYNDVAGAWVFSTLLLLSDDLTDFTSIRKCNFGLNAKSSTVSTTTAFLQGTVNAVSLLERKLSEINTLTYGGILTAVKDPVDVVAGVPLSTGITFVGPPVCIGQPEFRLDDTAPTSVITGLLTRSKYLDNAHNLSLSTIVSNTFAGSTFVAGTPVTIAKAVVNFDASYMLRGQCRIYYTFTGSAVGSLQVQASMRALDITGAAIATQFMGEYVDSVAIAAPDEGQANSFSGVIDLNALQSCAYVEFTATMLADVNQTWAALDITAEFVSESVGGMYKGVDYPLTVAIIDGATPASVLTLSGVAGYEVTPDPALSKNVDTNYGVMRTHEVNYTKLLYGRRQELGLRTVYSTLQYINFKDKLMALSGGSEKNVAMSADWKSLVRTLKNVAVAGVKSVFPGSSNLVDLGSNLVDAFLPKAASGKAYQWSADVADGCRYFSYDDGDSLPWEAHAADSSFFTRFPAVATNSNVANANRRDTAQERQSHWVRPSGFPTGHATSGSLEIPWVNRATRPYFFPVVNVADGTINNVSLWSVFRKTTIEDIPQSDLEALERFHDGNSMYIAPIVACTSDRIVVDLAKPHKLVGRSFEMARTLCDEDLLGPGGPLPVAFTGLFDADTQTFLSPALVALKRAALQAFGFTLVSPRPQHGEMTTLEQMRHYAKYIVSDPSFARHENPRVEWDVSVLPIPQSYREIDYFNGAYSKGRYSLSADALPWEQESEEEEEAEPYPPEFRQAFAAAMKTVPWKTLRPGPMRRLQSAVSSIMEGMRNGMVLDPQWGQSIAKESGGGDSADSTEEHKIAIAYKDQKGAFYFNPTKRPWELYKKGLPADVLKRSKEFRSEAELIRAVKEQLVIDESTPSRKTGKNAPRGAAANARSDVQSMLKGLREGKDQLGEPPQKVIEAAEAILTKVYSRYLGTKQTSGGPVARNRRFLAGQMGIAARTGNEDQLDGVEPFD